MENGLHVHVYINDVEYSDYCISYQREAKICTGVGNLSIEFEPNIPHDIIPYDHITIEENGNTLVGSYYVSSISKRQPSGEFQVLAQDGSKFLTDHFIDVNYYIDYPSYSLYWLEFFLTDAQVNYEILETDSSLLSPNSQLGMVSNYDQVLTLLQMNGWYMYFDAHDICHIGPLDKKLGSQDGEVNTDDILSIDILSHDKMLRNRVLVTGSASPTGSGYVSAEVIRHTPWNYDNLDIRTAVISNSAIPTNADAMELAVTAIDEFAQITVEKHITAKGAYFLFIGDVLRVRNEYFNGKGLVTTFGTSMDKSGLVSNIILDERCPRLFGFFKPSDLVYVGTYGDGVYGKQTVGGDPNWYDFSDGLAELGVTDLHINKGNFVCVTSGGVPYYSTTSPIISYANTPGSGLTFSGASDRGTVITGLDWRPISLENLHPTESGIVDVSYTYSGLKARAAIINRFTNVIKVAADTRANANLGDYLESTTIANLPFLLSGLVFDPNNPLASGVAASGFQSVIVDVTNAGAIGTVHPIKLSAEALSGFPGIEITDEIIASGLRKGIAVYDIEADPLTEYVSVGVNISGALSIGDGIRTNQITAGTSRINVLGGGTGFGSTDDSNMPTSYSMTKTHYEPYTDSVGDVFPIKQSVMGLWNHMTSMGKAYAAGISDASTYKLIEYYKDPGNEENPPVFTTNTFTKAIPSTGDPAGWAFNIPNAIYNGALGVFSYISGGRDSADNQVKLKKVDWNVQGNTTTVSHYNVTPNIPLGIPISTSSWQFGLSLNSDDRSNDSSFFVLGDFLYCASANRNPDHVGIQDLYFIKINLKTGDSDVRNVFSYTIEYPDTEIISASGAHRFGLFQYGDNDVQLVFHYITMDGSSVATGTWYSDSTTAHAYRYIQQGFENTGTSSEYASLGTKPRVSGGYSHIAAWQGASAKYNVQNTTQKKALFIDYYAPNDDGEGNPDLTMARWFVDTGETVTEFDHNPAEDYKKIYNINGVHDDLIYGVARKTDDTIVYFDLETAEYVQDVSVDTMVGVLDCMGVADALDGSIYFATDSGELNEFNAPLIKTVSARTNGSLVRNIDYLSYDYRTDDADRQIFGSFLVDTGSTLVPRVYYIDNKVPVDGTIYLVLQREDEWFNILKSGLLPDRLDISLYSPLVAMERTIESTSIFDITASGTVVALINPSLVGFSLGADMSSGLLFGSGLLANDFRYADILFGIGGIMTSDLYPDGTYSRQLLVAYSGGIGITDVSTLASFSGIVTSEHGIISRVETTNSVIPDQFIFAATSGWVNSGAMSQGVPTLGNGGFYQKDPSSVFVDYSSGYPAARTTIIRIDDSV